MNWVRGLLLIFLVLALVVAAGLVTNSTAHGASLPRHEQVIFNDPTKGDPKAIQNFVINKVNQQPKGSIVRVAMYSWTMTSISDALINAYHRGVHIQVVVDSLAKGQTPYAQLKSVLGSNPNAASYIVGCSSGCVGTNISHIKFVTFNSDNSVVVSSANFTNIHNWNNAIYFTGYTSLYAAYYHRFVAMKNDAVAHKHGPAKLLTYSEGDAKLYFYPEARSDNTLLAQLSNITRCSGTRVDVAVYQFTDASVARKLAALKKAGCAVRVALTAIPGYKTTVKNLKGIKVKVIPYDQTNGYLHSKELLIHGYYSGKMSYLTFMGSINFTSTGLHSNDEDQVKISNQSIYNQYESNFQEIYNG